MHHIKVLNENAYEAVKDYVNTKQYDLVIIDPIFDQQFDLLFFNVDKLVKETSNIFVFIDWKNQFRIMNYIQMQTKWVHHNTIVWARTSPGKNDHRFKTGFELILHYVINPEKATYNKQFRKLKDKDVLPYKNEDGSPRGWFYDETTGERVRWAEVNSVWHYTRPSWSAEEKTEHGMQKPLQLCDRIILSSTNVGDCVLDLFSGSGSFAVSAKMLQRNYLGYELNKNHYEAILKRLEECGSLEGYKNGKAKSRSKFNV